MISRSSLLKMVVLTGAYCRETSFRQKLVEIAAQPEASHAQWVRDGSGHTGDGAIPLKIAGTKHTGALMNVFGDNNGLIGVGHFAGRTMGEYDTQNQPAPSEVKVAPSVVPSKVKPFGGAAAGRVHWKRFFKGRNSLLKSVHGKPKKRSIVMRQNWNVVNAKPQSALRQKVRDGSQTAPFKVEKYAPSGALYAVFGNQKAIGSKHFASSGKAEYDSQFQPAEPQIVRKPVPVVSGNVKPYGGAGKGRVHWAKLYKNGNHGLLMHASKNRRRRRNIVL